MPGFADAFWSSDYAAGKAMTSPFSACKSQGLPRPDGLIQDSACYSESFGKVSSRTNNS